MSDEVLLLENSAEYTRVKRIRVWGLSTYSVHGTGCTVGIHFDPMSGVESRTCYVVFMCGARANKSPLQVRLQVCHV